MNVPCPQIIRFLPRKCIARKRTSLSDRLKRRVYSILLKFAECSFHPHFTYNARLFNHLLCVRLSLSFLFGGKDQVCAYASYTTLWLWLWWLFYTSYTTALKHAYTCKLIRNHIIEVMAVVRKTSFIFTFAFCRQSFRVSEKWKKNRKPKHTDEEQNRENEIERLKWAQVTLDFVNRYRALRLFSPFFYYYRRHHHFTAQVHI